MKTKQHPDAARIQALGGPAELARRLNFDTAKGGVQRVQNWLTRGIPPAVKVQHPDLFIDHGKKRPHAAVAKAS